MPCFLQFIPIHHFTGSIFTKTDTFKETEHMYTNSPVSLPSHFDRPQYNDIETTAHDLSILTMMIRQVEDIRKQVEQPVPLALPVITSATEPGQRSHRVIIYRPLPSDQQELQF